VSGRRIVPLDGVGTGAGGRAFLYLFPCAYEDFAKLGMSTDPLARLHAFSSRYYEFFDLQRGWRGRVIHWVAARAAPPRVRHKEE